MTVHAHSPSPRGEGEVLKTGTFRELAAAIPVSLARFQYERERELVSRNKGIGKEIIEDDF